MRRLAPALAFAASLATLPALAQDAEMSADDRLALHAEIRAYLLEHPEVLVEAMNGLQTREDDAAAQRDLAMLADNAEVIFQNPNDWVGGNPEGDVVLVEFMDYRCGYCRKAYSEVEELVNSDGNIRLVIKEFPILGPQSEVMSRFAVAVQQLGGDTPSADVHERLMGWDGDIADADIRAISAELGLDGDAVLAQMSDGAVTEVLRANHELAQRLQISGTPTFVLGSGDGGELLRGFMQADEMEAVATRLRG